MVMMGTNRQSILRQSRLSSSGVSTGGGGSNSSPLCVVLSIVAGRSVSSDTLSVRSCMTVGRLGCWSTDIEDERNVGEMDILPGGGVKTLS